VQFSGDFETHVTVTSDPARWSALVAWADTEQVKVTHIVLDRGSVCSQPMVTLTGTGPSAIAMVAARAVSDRLTAAGFEVVRLKVEVEPQASGVPRDNDAALLLGDDLHFEHHVKIHLPAPHDRRELSQLVIPHQAHLSRNARRIADDGGQELFVTQRCFGVGLPEASRRLRELRASLSRSAVQELSVEQEFVIFDSNLALDNGWLPAKGDDDGRR